MKDERDDEERTALGTRYDHGLSGSVSVRANISKNTVRSLLAVVGLSVGGGGLALLDWGDRIGRGDTPECAECVAQRQRLVELIARYECALATSEAGEALYTNITGQISCGNGSAASPQLDHRDYIEPQIFQSKGSGE